MLADIPSRVSWRALKSVIKYSSRTSALFRELFGEQAEWGPTEHLLAANYDINAIIAWLASDTKRNKRPDPMQRPGMKNKSDDQALGAGSTVMVSEFRDLWNAATADLEEEVP